ncbi:hypothetical protein ACIBKZ_14380 [Streptomyces sp. NPDC050421]|uniref:hypothetical protein n=1 Tax=unclassified Streptomyces TaxID=2593676 RepID=UPI003794C945
MTSTDMSAPTRHDRRMFAVMNDRRASALYATAARRRTAVAAHVTLTAAGLATGIGAYASDQRWPAFALLAMVLPWCVATGAINGATRGLLELRTPVLDERQVAERDRVRARAHRLTTLLLAIALGVVAGGDWTGRAEAETLLLPVLATVFVAHWLMPLWVAGLTVRDEAEPEEELF